MCKIMNGFMAFALFLLCGVSEVQAVEKMDYGYSMFNNILDTKSIWVLIMFGGFLMLLYYIFSCGSNFYTLVKDFITSLFSDESEDSKKEDMGKDIEKSDKKNSGRKSTYKANQ